MRRWLFAIALVTLCLPLHALEVSARTPYITRSMSRGGALITTQDAYEPVKNIRTYGSDKTFISPRDIFFDVDDRLFVVDTHAQKIIVFDQQLSYIADFGEDVLIRPLGIHVRDDIVYVADYGSPEDLHSGRVHLFTFDGHEAIHLESRQRPESPVLSIGEFVYRPEKIAIDRNHTMYVVSEGSYNGILMINANNRFLSYFAPNTVGGTWFDRVVQILYGNNPEARLSRRVPPAPNNVVIDDTGFIYTVTQSIVRNNLGDTLRRVNIGGVNFFPPEMFAASDFVAADTGTVGNIIALSRSGFIFEYDQDGQLLYMFAGPGATGDRTGLFQGASAISVRSDGLLVVADDVAGSLHVLTPTRFTETVHAALALFNEGRYVESEALWREVLRFNAMFDQAHLGIGMSHFLQGDFEEAMTRFAIADAKVEYSEAFWEVRNVWLLAHGATVFGIFLVGAAGWTGVKRTSFFKRFARTIKAFGQKLLSHDFLKELVFITHYLKHPADACFEVKSAQRSGFRAAGVWLLGLGLIYLAHLTLTGFLFAPIVLEEASFIEEFARVMIPFVTFIFGHYLVATLMEGEGSFKAVFVNTTGAFIPVIILFPPLIALSTVLTYNEQFIYYFGLTVMGGWTVLYLFVTVRETHQFTLRETLFNLFLTVLMMIVLIIVVIMLYIMIVQLFGFVQDLIREVAMRG